MSLPCKPIALCLASLCLAVPVLAVEDDGLSRLGDEDKPAAQPVAPPRKQAPPKAPAAQPEAPAATAPTTGPDAHFVRGGEYFIADKGFPDSGWIHVYLASLQTAPSDGSKGQGSYLRLHDGKDIWTAFAWSTRIARTEDIKLGAWVILLDDSEEGVYRAPKDRHEATSSAWFAGRITDVSDLFKNEVMIAGHYRAHPNALRIPTPYTGQ